MIRVLIWVVHVVAGLSLALAWVAELLASEADARLESVGEWLSVELRRILTVLAEACFTDRELERKVRPSQPQTPFED